MNIHDMRIALGCTQKEFAWRYNIPYRTIQNWESGVRQPPDYLCILLEYRVNSDLANSRTLSLPKYDSKKKNLPKRSDYIGAISWLKAVKEHLGDDVVFALDEALMCQGNFGGHSDEYLVWIYGEDKATEYNGVVVIGNHISKYCVENRNGLNFTNFNRTISDAFANEKMLDMQGITEAVSNYYFAHNESFEGIFVAPEYQERFDELAEDAIAYYES